MHAVRIVQNIYNGYTLAVHPTVNAMQVWPFPRDSLALSFSSLMLTSFGFVP
jgi:hypothetical protein